jgi:prevent-host-death family protein
LLVGPPDRPRILDGLHGGDTMTFVVPVQRRHRWLAIQTHGMLSRRAGTRGEPRSLMYPILDGVTRMTATEAARSFSDVLNRVASGEVVEVTRRGAPVAVIGPPRPRTLSAQRFRALMASVPGPDDAFADELAAARETIGTPAEPWPS